MTREDSWSANWACSKLISYEDIQSANARDTNQIELSVKNLQRPVHIATMSVETVRSTDLNELCTSSDIEFAMNIKKDALYDQSAIQFSESRPIGIGGLGDLYRAAREREFRNYLPKETRFILRGLRQHTAVTNVQRLNNRLYRIERRSRQPMTVLALNDYDLTAESVRDGIDRFGTCDIILASNPNCRASGESVTAAKHCGVRVLKWGQLLGALNH
ncbi:hypothetical protein Q31b_40510 [Novipirellula aureliae]|uniref:Uncharacterized protein n=2 Tax=Novipirellula aureliae TaxID=2527966 RepID=A0A5C6DNV7_9BACT|nr:hypothetical protein Q31b_40510 [Novipirellula aureliae]